MQQVDGVGGAFVFSEDPKRLSEWYSRHLGMQFDGSEEFGAFYQIFVGLDPDDPARRLDTTFAIMRAKAPLPRPSHEPEPQDMYGDQPFMVNLRVRDLDGLLAELADAGVEAIKREDEGYGLFAWIRDGDGNRLELYQPVPGEQAQ